MVLENIRVSIGSASALGLRNTKSDVAPTTCYIMTYKKGYCSANCGFCPQSRSSKTSAEKLSRINWPIFDFKTFLMKLKYLSALKKFKRICIQTLKYPQNFEDLKEIVSRIREVSDIPISIAIPPMDKDQLEHLKLIGVQRVGIALDGATEELFERVKGDGVNGPYSWSRHFDSLKEALEVFRKGNVSTHLIVGLGETTKEIITLLDKLHKMCITSALFAFTPVKGTKLANLQQPPELRFRKIQLARHLILHENKHAKDFTFNSKEDLINFNINKNRLWRVIDEEKEAFMTSGCPDCNRPFYTSRPSGPIYNYPRPLHEKEKKRIYQNLTPFVR
ncbi:MAG: radical SAM protein [Promethearchaeia archaeon]